MRHVGLHTRKQGETTKQEIMSIRAHEMCQSEGTATREISSVLAIHQICFEIIKYAFKLWVSWRLCTTLFIKPRKMKRRVGSKLSRGIVRCDPPFVCFSTWVFSFTTCILFFDFVESRHQFNSFFVMLFASLEALLPCLHFNPRAHSILIKNSVSGGNYFYVVFTETPLKFIFISQDFKIMFSELHNYVFIQFV